MPYDPLAPQIFREILQSLIQHFKLTRQDIRDATIAHRKQRGLPAVVPFIDRSTLGRFINGSDIKSVGALEAVWEYLESVDRYKPFFLSESYSETRSPDAELASGLARVFSASGATKPHYDLNEVRRRLAGEYITYRPSQRRGQTGLYRTALLRIMDRDDGANVTETRAYPATDTDAAYRQTDRGFLFTHGRYVYLLMMDNNSISTVRLQVATEVMPWGGSDEVNYFCGESFSSTDRGVFPSIRFFCRKLRAGVDQADTFVSKYLTLDTIPDAAAVAFLGP